MRGPDPITEVRLYRCASDPADLYAAVYVTESGDMIEIAGLKPWTPTADHKIEVSIDDPELVHEFIADMDMMAAAAA